MRITAVRATPVNIPFHAPYRFSLGSTASVTKTIVEVETDEGVTGIGECADGDRSAEVDAPRRAPDRARPARPQRVRAPLRAGVRALAVGERDDAQARVRGDRDGALGSRADGPRTSPCTCCSAAPCGARSRSPSTSRCAIPAPSHPGESTPLEVARYCARMIEEYDSPTFEGKLATVGAGGRAGDGARGARRDRRPPAATRREPRLDRPDRARRAAQARAVRHPLHRGARRIARGAGAPAAVHGHRVLGARARPAARRRARRARLLRAQHRRARRHPTHGRVRARLRAVRHRLLVPLGRHRRARAPPTCSSRPRWSRSASPARRSSTGTPTTSSRRAPSARGGGVLPVPDGSGLGVTLDAEALARCHERFLAEGAFPSGEAGAPERTQGSFGALRRS